MATAKKTGTFLSWTIIVTLLVCAAVSSASAAETVARPSNPGGPGEAATMSGNPVAGAKIFATYCQACHGVSGKKGVVNPGSTDGRVPALNPIDATLRSRDPKIFALNLDLFIENGSMPEGSKPQLIMAAWGKDKEISQQQIADVIAYIIRLNLTK